MIEPVNDFILVKPITDEVSKGGIILVAGEKAMRPDKGKVLGVGPGKYVNGVLEPMRIKKGQTILFQQYPAFDFTENGHKVTLVREIQVVAVVE